MSITNMLFLFLFLPLALVIYYIANDKAKEYVLLAISLLFYAIGSLEYVTLFIFAIVMTVMLARSMQSIKTKLFRRLLLVAGILINAGLLVYYKYTDFMISSFNYMSGSAIELKCLALPLGISFFTFKAISYLVDVYWEKATLNEPPIHDALYLSFFAQVQSGPLTRYNDMKLSKHFVNGKEARTMLFSDGVFRFLIGFNKKILLANVLANITNEVFATPFENYTVAYAWLGSICYSLQLFFDFAGYSDMAIGLSEMFGYECMENFNYPYMTESVAKFWRRWHISLSQWFRDYIYFPLGGSRNKNKFKVYFNLFVVWVFTGIWHGASWNFVAWGLGYFALISFERITGMPERLKTKIGKLIYRIFTLIFINCQWILFRADGIVAGLRFIKRLFICENNHLTNMRTLFLIKDYFSFILCAILLCFPIVPWIGKRLKSRKILHAIYEVVFGIIVIGLFFWAVSFVVSGQNNPFAYANF